MNLNYNVAGINAVLYEGVENINVSEFVSGHNDYGNPKIMEKISKFIEIDNSLVNKSNVTQEEIDAFKKYDQKEQAEIAKQKIENNDSKTDDSNSNNDSKNNNKNKIENNNDLDEMNKKFENQNIMIEQNIEKDEMKNEKEEEEEEKVNKDEINNKQID
jgi:hypothetical protein